METLPLAPQLNVVLIGFMGSGKTTAGIEAARMLQFSFLDTDKIIAEEAGASISDIFKKKGEDFFRKQETDILKKLLAQKTSRTVIATGGGIISRKENILLLKKLGCVIWLCPNEESLLNRLLSSNHDRPLLQRENPAEYIKELYHHRKALYENAANLTIENSDLTLSETATGIAESAYFFFKQKQDKN